MAKRISVKGKGADIFFGDYPASAMPPDAKIAGPNPDPPPTSDDEPLVHESVQESKQESTHARFSTSKEASLHANEEPNSLDDLNPGPLPAPDNERIAQEGMQESKQEGRKESIVSRKKARLQETKGVTPAPNQVPSSPLAIEVLRSIWQRLSERATITNSFRYTDQELSWLTDALYEITKRHHVKLTKQDIARLGLNAVLWDYRVRGDSSLLSEFATKRKHQEEGEQ